MWAIPRAIYPLRTPIAAQSKKIWLTWERTDGQLICSMIRAPHLTNTAHYILPQTGKDILLPLSARGMSMLPYWLIHYIIEQDPKMEVLHHIRSYFAGIFPYVGLIYALYMVGTSNLGSWHGHWMCIYIYHSLGTVYQPTQTIDCLNCHCWSQITLFGWWIWGSTLCRQSMST